MVLSMDVRLECTEEHVKPVDLVAQAYEVHPAQADPTEERHYDTVEE